MLEYICRLEFGDIVGVSNNEWNFQWSWGDWTELGNEISQKEIYGIEDFTNVYHVYCY